MGIYDVACENCALVVPVATYRNGNKVYGIMEKTFDICVYDRAEGIKVLKDKLVTMKYGMIEKYGQGKHSDFPYGEKANFYWKNHIDDLMAKVRFYGYEIEFHTK